MSEAVVVALISGAVSLVSVLITVLSTRHKIEKKIEIEQAVTDTKITELTREVREHNNYARRVPVLEEQMKVANHRLEDLENGK